MTASVDTETKSTRPLYQKLAALVGAVKNCQEANNAEWENKHTESIELLVDRYMPSGSGFDNGTVLDIDCADKFVRGLKTRTASNP